ncbi:HalOD1 output domain-containing protein [Halobaculum lipolyticum]|uniref:HalOD1 output domain-containing protein n=1 Tax=Halobaculum lipolyticum TaxID=3032001 RepID=A0ABD5WCE4_9EURY|nr:HalOD1 output domain-containing protein [Halobaculum sp. DT31]
MTWDIDRSDDGDAGASVRAPAEEGTLDAVSIRVVECVADATSRRTTALEPLYGVVDPDALDALFPPVGRGGCSVSFRFEGTLVEVSGAGDVTAVPVPADD